MLDIYDAAVEQPTTRKGLAEHVRVKLANGDEVDVRLPVFRQNRLSKEWVKTTLWVCATTTDSGVVDIHARVLMPSTSSEAAYYERDLREHGLLSDEGWRGALETLNLRMGKPRPPEKPAATSRGPDTRARPPR